MDASNKAPQRRGQKRKDASPSTQERKGFKHELILALLARDFTFWEAELLIESTFDSVKHALLRKEDVAIERFGTWQVVARSTQRKWRFGKVIEPKPYKIVFQADESALAAAWDPDWKAHPAWEKTRTKPPTLRGRKLAEWHRAQRDSLRDQYIKTIVAFFRDDPTAQDWPMFWNVRWHSPWFAGEAARTQPANSELRPIEAAAQVIKASRPLAVSKDSSSRMIDYVCWYARWTQRLIVDADLWNEAENKAREILRRG